MRNLIFILLVLATACQTSAFANDYYNSSRNFRSRVGNFCSRADRLRTRRIAEINSYRANLARTRYAHNDLATLRQLQQYNDFDRVRALNQFYGAGYADPFLGLNSYSRSRLGYSSSAFVAPYYGRQSFRGRRSGLNLNIGGRRSFLNLNIGSRKGSLGLNVGRRQRSFCR